MWPEFSLHALAGLAALLGLLVGSFVNVVIHRMPLMMQADWARECAEFSGHTAFPARAAETPALTLSQPRSRCPHCGHPIAWHDNIPVLSYVLLRGKCSACGVAYGPRYVLVELGTGILFYLCVLRWGGTLTALAWCGCCAALLALAGIDWDTTLLPDDITLPLLWAGLALAALQSNPGVSLADAFWGAVGGYLSLWLVYQVFKRVTGKEGMGYGDFKLFAALGAWFGWTALVPIILIASLVGAAVGLVLKRFSTLRAGDYLPFGPFLVGAGLLMLGEGPAAALRWWGLVL